jgi:hypothetical protein
VSLGVRRDLLILACAVSAGVHAALVPEHLREGAAAGGGFILASVLLLALVVALTLASDPRRPAAVAALTFVGLLVSYLVVVWQGVPVLHPESERIDGLALVTKAIETGGIFLSIALVRRPLRRSIPLPLTMLIAVFSALVTLAVSDGMKMTSHAAPVWQVEQR